MGGNPEFGLGKQAIIINQNEGKEEKTSQNYWLHAGERFWGRGKVDQPVFLTPLLGPIDVHGASVLRLIPVDR